MTELQAILPHYLFKRMSLYIPNFRLSPSKRDVQVATVSAVNRSLRFKIIPLVCIPKLPVPGLRSSRLFDGRCKNPRSL